MLRSGKTLWRLGVALTLRQASLCLVLVPLLFPLGLLQQRPTLPAEREAQSRRLVSRWQENLREIERLLAQGKGKNAYREATTVLYEMTEAIISGPGTAELLGTATVLRAIAAVQLGRAEEGIWHWQIAQQMFPEVADYRMSAYGDIGPFLKKHPPREASEPPEVSGPVGDEFEPPQKIKAPHPNVPAAKRQGDPVTVKVQTIIGKDGVVRSPLILDSEGELTLVCATLDTLREWRFEPARVEGKPVEVPFTLSVQFKP